MIQFVIITPGRSGSTFLARTLKQHPEVHCEEEIFNRAVHNEGSFNHFARSNAIYRLVGVLFNREKLSTRPWNVPLKWLISRFLRTKDGGNRGFKISLDQLFAYPQLFSLLSPYRVIYLTREDRHRMVLSLLAARKTGDYESFSGQPVTLKPAEVKQQLDQLTAWEERSVARFEDVLFLTAEQLFEEQEPSLEKIQKFLALTSPLSPVPMTRTHPVSIAEWVENYDEIAAYLQSAP